MNQDDKILEHFDDDFCDLFSRYLILILGLLLSCNNPKSEEKATETTISQIVENPTNKIGLSTDIIWEQMNPARGDKSPLAGTIWGNRKDEVPTGYIGKFVDGGISLE